MPAPKYKRKETETIAVGIPELYKSEIEYIIESGLTPISSMSEFFRIAACNGLNGEDMAIPQENGHKLNRTTVRLIKGCKYEIDKLVEKRKYRNRGDALRTFLYNEILNQHPKIEEHKDNLEKINELKKIYKFYEEYYKK